MKSFKIGVIIATGLSAISAATVVIYHKLGKNRF